MSEQSNFKLNSNQNTVQMQMGEISHHQRELSPMRRMQQSKNYYEKSMKNKLYAKWGNEFLEIMSLQEVYHELYGIIVWVDSTEKIHEIQELKPIAQQFNIQSYSSLGELIEVLKRKPDATIKLICRDYSVVESIGLHFTQNSSFRQIIYYNSEVDFSFKNVQIGEKYFECLKPEGLRNQIIRGNDFMIDGIWNFSQFSSREKKSINQKRLILFWLLLPTDEVSSFSAFSNFISNSFEKKNQCQNQKEITEKYLNLQIPISIQNYWINFYTEECCFYRLLNRSLRIFKEPAQLAYLRSPFRQLFHQIRELFISQENQPFRQQEFTCYRGTKMTNDEIRSLQKSINSYIQLEGFISTSLNKNVVEKFFLNSKNTIFEITVPPVKSRNTLFQGFANLNKVSKIVGEQQIVFNPLNCFKVMQVEQNSDQFTIFLKYVGYVEDEGEEALLKNTIQKVNYSRTVDYHEEMLSKISNQGDVYLEMELYCKAKNYYIDWFQFQIEKCLDDPDFQITILNAADWMDHSLLVDLMRILNYPSENRNQESAFEMQLKAAFIKYFTKEIQGKRTEILPKLIRIHSEIEEFEDMNCLTQIYLLILSKVKQNQKDVHEEILFFQSLLEIGKLNVENCMGKTRSQEFYGGHPMMIKEGQQIEVGLLGWGRQAKFHADIGDLTKANFYFDKYQQMKRKIYPKFSIPTIIASRQGQSSLLYLSYQLKEAIINIQSGQREKEKNAVKMLRRIIQQTSGVEMNLPLQLRIFIQTSVSLSRYYLRNEHQINLKEGKKQMLLFLQTMKAVKQELLKNVTVIPFLEIVDAVKKCGLAEQFQPLLIRVMETLQKSHQGLIEYSEVLLGMATLYSSYKPSTAKNVCNFLGKLQKNISQTQIAPGALFQILTLVKQIYASIGARSGEYTNFAFSIIKHKIIDDQERSPASINLLSIISTHLEKNDPYLSISFTSKIQKINTGIEGKIVIIMLLKEINIMKMQEKFRELVNWLHNNQKKEIVETFSEWIAVVLFEAGQIFCEAAEKNILGNLRDYVNNSSLINSFTNQSLRISIRIIGIKSNSRFCDWLSVLIHYAQFWRMINEVKGFAIFQQLVAVTAEEIFRHASSLKKYLLTMASSKQKWGKREEQLRQALSVLKRAGRQNEEAFPRYLFIVIMAIKSI